MGEKNLTFAAEEKYVSAERKHLLLPEAEIRSTCCVQLLLIISMIFGLFLLIGHSRYPVLSN